MLFVLASLAIAAPLPDAPSTNLLTSVPCKVAVSSRVRNAKILPAHLVDGDPATAWNSQTGELVGAWIAVRVPPGVHVDALKMTAGFTFRDAHGDLFTMNPRVRAVRVLHNGNVVEERHALDIESRELQTIPLDVTSGEVRVEVVDVVPGTKSAWRELCVSELEVWGAPGPESGPTPAPGMRPTVRVGRLDPLPYPECVAAVLPTASDDGYGEPGAGEYVAAIERFELTSDTSACRVDLAKTGSSETRVHLVPIGAGGAGGTGGASGTGKAKPKSWVARPAARQDSGVREGDAVRITSLPLIASETGLVVSRVHTRTGPMFEETTTTSTLFRVQAGALVPLLDWTSRTDTGEVSDETQCELGPFQPSADWPTLELLCTHFTTRWPDGAGKSSTTARPYRWSGSRFEPAGAAVRRATP